jgi:hypothetical protein
MHAGVVHANITLLIACMIHIICIILLKLDRIFPEISGIKVICKVKSTRTPGLPNFSGVPELTLEF